MKFKTDIQNLQPEDQLILTCLQHQQTLPKLNFDEDRLIHRMNYHRVTSMVYQHLLNIDGLGILSAKTQAKLKEHYHFNIYHNLAIRSLVNQLSKILESSSIEVMVLKGANFIQSFPDYDFIREMSDLDIMVKPEKLDQALKVLSTIGLEDLVNFGNSKSQRKKWSIQTACNAIPLQGQDSYSSNITVEAHWQLFSANNQTTWSTQELWERAAYCPEENVHYLALSDTLLHLCAHQCNDLQIYLYGLVDVAVFLKLWSETLDWVNVIRCAKSQRVLLHLVNILRLSNELLNAPLPDIYFTSLKSYELQAQPGYEFLIERLFRKEFVENSHKAASLLTVFRRLEYSNQWHRLWFEMKLPIPLGIRLRINYYFGRHLRKVLGFL